MTLSKAQIKEPKSATLDQRRALYQAAVIDLSAKPLSAPIFK